MNEDRPIEKLLRRYAKKRRDDAGAPLELHHATRRMLQGEVARLFPKRAPAGDRAMTTFAQIWQGWRTRWIWAVPMVIVLGAGLWVLVGPNGKPGDKLAKNRLARAAPANAGEESFRAVEADRAAVRSVTALAAPAPAYGKIPPAKQEPAVTLPADEAIRFAVAPDRATVPPKRGDATAIPGPPADFLKDSAVTRRPKRVEPGGVNTLTGWQGSRSQAEVTRRELTEPTGGHTSGKIPAMGVASSSVGRSDGPAKIEGIRQDYSTASENRHSSTPASRPAVIPPARSNRYSSDSWHARSGHEKLKVYSQAFANRGAALKYGGTYKDGSFTAVLENFQVEQSGNELRVIDGDGSTYVGEMNAPMKQQVTKVGFEEKVGEKLYLPRDSQLAARQLAGVASQELQNYAYRVAGTNRTLNQPVIFTWNFEALTNRLAAAQIKIRSGGGNVMNQVLPGQQFQSLLNNSAINGRAQLGDAKEIEINAVPVSP